MNTYPVVDFLVSRSPAKSSSEKPFRDVVQELPPKQKPINVGNGGNWLQEYSWYKTAMDMKKKEPEVQVASFMTIIGSDAQKNYCTFVLSPEETKQVEEIKKRFTNYFLPKK
ncbi:hypothetical protein LAZ67_X002340 [Cordylochernes scorpioides]|uniref:Uncharacterized protein n=1 Tax=Cordylochernes scorpioides TaxID=51811 RepID=A0ABY6LT96_9ARAC|nr:hypothetical protein LAZ67_X002340 [Cordylochernes scorpioides]